jgi:hypothetical protein
MQPADLFKLAELVVLFVAIGGFLGWEYWRTRKLILADRKAAAEAAKSEPGD